jgi:hypothetical protein
MGLFPELYNYFIYILLQWYIQIYDNLITIGIIFFIIVMIPIIPIIKVKYHKSE